ncbi:MAG TPA: hypothetical protein VM165_14920 [Planctomycetaceae bacterium]|nr:hypothetical protein [Planctomycetaceae bacterium]
MTESYPPGCTIRTFPVGGLSKPNLLAKLAANRIELNESARRIIDSDQFLASNFSKLVTTVELAARDLGFPEGATTVAIHENALDRRLCLCSLEVGPYFRLHHIDQPEGAKEEAVRRHRAPPGSITVASMPPSADDDFPKGFYVRRIDGVLWLRGYRASADHVWDADDHFLFALRSTFPA